MIRHGQHACLGAMQAANLTCCALPSQASAACNTPLLELLLSATLERSLLTQNGALSSHGLHAFLNSLQAANLAVLCLCTRLCHGCLSVLQAKSASQTAKDASFQSPGTLSTEAHDQPSATSTAQPPPSMVQSHDMSSAVQSQDTPSEVQSHDMPSEVQSHETPSEIQSHAMLSEVQSHDTPSGKQSHHTPSVPAVVSEQAEAADEDEQEAAAAEISNGPMDIDASEDPAVLFIQAGALADALARHLRQGMQDQHHFLKTRTKQIMKSTQILSNTDPENQLLRLTQDMCAMELAVLGHLSKVLSSRDKDELLARHAEVADSLLRRHKAVILAAESADENVFLNTNRQAIARLGRQLTLVSTALPL